MVDGLKVAGRRCRATEGFRRERHLHWPLQNADGNLRGSPCLPGGLCHLYPGL